MIAPLLNWEALEEDKSLAVEDFISDGCQKLGEVWEWEVAL